MTITLTISEVCQIILVVVALISLFRGAGKPHQEKEVTAWLVPKRLLIFNCL